MCKPRIPVFLVVHDILFVDTGMVVLVLTLIFIISNEKMKKRSQTRSKRTIQYHPTV
jgi:hypothetical protein